ncbi:MAG: cyclodeaminase/cyclohydrolase family protein [Oscillospiraceae bacterium]|nr:cyclodeaminase/cyclohydrolase family protein [Oscillospiraceae bacterium]
MDFDFGKMTVSSFVEELASSSPAPGGGAVAGLNGAQAMALASMVCEVSAASKKMTDLRDELLLLANEAKTVMRRFIDLANMDAAAYDSVIKAMALPKDTEEKKAERTACMQTSMKSALSVPLEMMGTCLDGIKLCRRISDTGYLKSIESDLAAAKQCLRTAIICAENNVDANIPYIKDEGFCSAADEKRDSIKKEFAELL